MCTVLGIWVAIQWLASCVGYSFGGKWQFLTLIHGLLGLYFNFQFITNLASIATKYQKEGCDYDKKLLKYRTIEVIVQSVFLIYTNLTFLSTEVLLGISSVVGIVSLFELVFSSLETEISSAGTSIVVFFSCGSPLPHSIVLT